MRPPGPRQGEVVRKEKKKRGKLDTIHERVGEKPKRGEGGQNPALLGMDEAR